MAEELRALTDSLGHHVVVGQVNTLGNILASHATCLVAEWPNHGNHQIAMRLACPVKPPFLFAVSHTMFETGAATHRGLSINGSQCWGPLMNNGTTKRINAFRTIPHSIEAEQAVLGALMISDSAYERIADLLVEDDFYCRDHRLIWRAIIARSQARLPIDPVTLSDWFQTHGEETISQIGTYLIEIANATPSAANIVAYASIVREKSILRRLIDASTLTIEDCHQLEGLTVQETVERAEQRIFQIAEARTRGTRDIIRVNKALTLAYGQILERFQKGRGLLGVSTGFTALDEMTSGLRPSDLIIVAARPSMGKTSLAMNMAETVAVREKKPVVIFSMEMSAAQLAFRLIASVGRVNQTHLSHGDLPEEDWPKVSEAIKQISGSLIFIDEGSTMSPAELATRARRVHREHGGLGLIVIDYLQLMGIPGNSENRATEISMISRALKALAKELNVPVVALSQLNRSLEQRADKRPMMSDLRESGAIEQDADLILFIYRDEYYNKDSIDKGIAEVIIGKQRNGSVGTVRLTFLGQYTRFDNESNYSFQGAI